ncbi:MAG: hypothetical protein R3330_02230, partial [Saprospiraceae bacterium]|nr:hypothetical protein [Saprospiraceae bacterium]
GARACMVVLRQQPDVVVAIATGGWQHCAQFKLEAGGLDLAGCPIATSDDHFDRRVIVQTAIHRSLHMSGASSLDSVTYIGDGLWDLHAARELGVRFVGMDLRQNGRLQQAGAELVLQDLHDPGRILKWLTE